MDLVTSYLSDDSETEKKSKETKTTQKVIDIIELEDTDPEMKDSESSPVKILKNSKPSSLIENKNKPVKVIECIDIGESDNEEPAQKNTNDDDFPKINSLESNSVSNKSQTNLKENDYLNLHDSDSDEEQKIIQDNVNNLLNSAAVLSDVQCGPQKLNSENASFSDVVSTPINKLDLESHTTASLASRSFDSTSQCGSRINTPELSVISNDKNSSMADGTMHKRIKRETETPKSCTSATNVDGSEADEIGMPSTYMYRKDERINGAFAKSVICRLPRQVTRNYAAHSNSVTSLNWCIPKYSHLLLSASADGTVKIWDMYCKHPVQRLKSNLGLKAAKWSVTGEQIVTGGYGRKAHVYDVLSGKEIISYDVYHYVNSIEIHPYMEDVFLCGTRNAIFGFDLRVNSSLPIRTFLSMCEEVLDIVFLDENEFICSTNVVSHDSADRTIMVWDFSTGAIMSNQIYLERYTCPSLKVHPYDSCFIAQTNGDYIASFSTCKPYKIKDRIYKGHKVSGFGIECDISPDGKYIASGDANGDVYFYSYNNTNIINKLSIKSNTAVNKLKWHPALNSVMAVATWDGYVQIWK